jgi:GT2 family glycosyltransferase
MLSALYLRVVVALRITDALWRLAPLPDPVADPGPPGGTRVTFIVPTHNQRELMDLCLPPLLEEAGPVHKVLVVDDASTDGTAEHVRRRYPRVRVVRLTRNRGFARAARAGIAACDTPLFALINSDVQVRPGFLAAILPHFERDDVFAVCARIELPGGSQMETGNVAPSFSGILEPYHLPPGKPGPILFAGGASSVFHRARYDALGGFETIFQPLYWEDIDLGYRAWRAGWRSLFEPAASVWHQRRAWIGPRFGDALANETFLKNSLVFVWKNLRDRAMLTQHWVYVCARLYQEILRGEGTMCRALLRALPALLPALVRRWRARRRGDLSDRDVLAVVGEAAGRAARRGVRGLLRARGRGGRRQGAGAPVRAGPGTAAQAHAPCLQLAGAAPAVGDRVLLGRAGKRFAGDGPRVPARGRAVPQQQHGPVPPLPRRARCGGDRAGAVLPRLRPANQGGAGP